MLPPEDAEPLRWRELCSQLQAEKDPAKFQALLEEINRVLTAHEKQAQQSEATPVVVKNSKR